MNTEDGKLKFEYAEPEQEKANGIKIKVIGVGGCGCNIINDMADFDLKAADLIAVNTDLQSMKLTNVENKIQIGKLITRGGGAGSNAEKGAAAAEEDRETLENALRGTDMLFITCGLGGGTGSGAAPVIADIARSLDILTVAVIITPFKVELRNSGKKKRVEDATVKLRDKVHSVITISNEKMNEVCEKGMSIPDAYKEVNRALIETVNGIVNMIVITGMQNIDFEDVKTALKQKGDTFLGIGRASGTDRSKKALELALNNKYIGEMDINGAKELLINFTGNIGLSDLKEIENLTKLTGNDVGLKYGVVNDMSLGNEIEVVLLISGINNKPVIIVNPDEIISNREARSSNRGSIKIKNIMDNDYVDAEIPTFQRNTVGYN